MIIIPNPVAQLTMTDCETLDNFISRFFLGSPAGWYMLHTYVPARNRNHIQVLYTREESYVCVRSTVVLLCAYVLRY